MRTPSPRLETALAENSLPKLAPSLRMRQVPLEELLA